MFRQGINAALNEMLPWEIGELHRSGGDVYGLCVCLLSLFEDEKAEESRCGLWIARRKGENKFELEFKGTFLKEQKNEGEKDKNR